MLRALRDSGDLLVTGNGHTKVSEATGEEIQRDPRLTRRLRMDRGDGRIRFPRAYVFAGPRRRWSNLRPTPEMRHNGGSEEPKQGRFIPVEIGW